MICRHRRLRQETHTVFPSTSSQEASLPLAIAMRCEAHSPFAALRGCLGQWGEIASATPSFAAPTALRIVSCIAARFSCAQRRVTEAKRGCKSQCESPVEHAKNEMHIPNFPHTRSQHLLLPSPPFSLHLSLSLSLHTHIHTYIHTHIHTHIHTYIKCINVQIHAFVVRSAYHTATREGANE